MNKFDQKILLKSTLVCLGVVLIGLWWSTRQARTPSRSTTLIVGTNAEYPPFEFVENGSLDGFDIELIKLVAQRMGKVVSFKDMPFTTLIPQLANGSIDIIAAGLTPTPERSEQMLFTQPYLVSDYLIAISLKEIKAPEVVTDLENKQVIVNDGFTADLYLSKFPAITLVRLASVPDAFLALQKKRGHYFVVGYQAAKQFFDQYGSEQFNIAQLPDTGQHVAFGLKKNNAELKNLLDATLETLEADGSLSALRNKWKLE